MCKRRKARRARFFQSATDETAIRSIFRFSYLENYTISQVSIVVIAVRKRLLSLSLVRLGNTKFL